MEPLKDIGLPEKYSVTDKITLSDIQSSLDAIDRKLEFGMSARQRTVDLQEQEIKRLHLLLEGKNKQILELSDDVTAYKNSAEGNRQLINKLLNDIERLQQDVEWYKRTFETRSLLGTLKQKLFGTIGHKK
ncbi:MAG: hypothetical protein J0M10_05430 [Chitinophagales bacterium]|nr:hypothetical protein [Chitinophagales bacterium]